MHRLILLLALIAAPALAGTRATYTKADSPPLVIELADNGDVRVGPQGGSEYGVLTGGVFHVVGDKQGRVTVARIDDVAAAMGQVLPSLFRDILAAAPPAGALKAKSKGAATVGGRAGKRYEITAPDGSPQTLIVSEDPALRPVGQALEGFTTASILPMATLFGPVAKEMLADMRAMFKLGTPLQTPDGLTLASVETVAVAPDRVALPAAPMTVEALVADMRAEMTAKPTVTARPR